jgi:hypothetical protein
MAIAALLSSSCCGCLALITLISMDLLMHIKNPSLIGLTVDKHNERRETYENIE